MIYIAERPDAPFWNEEHLRLAVEAACVALWSWHVDDDHFEMDDRAFPSRNEFDS